MQVPMPKGCISRRYRAARALPQIPIYNHSGPGINSAVSPTTPPRLYNESSPPKLPMLTTIETPPSTAALCAQEAAIAGRKYIKKKAVRRKFTSLCTFFSILLFTLGLAQGRAMAADLAGNVQGAGLPIAGSTVTLYTAGTGAPTQLAQGKTDDNGAFDLNVDQTPADTVLYLIAKGGTPKAAADKGPNDAIALIAVLGTELPKTVIVNELTTVASVWTSAQFLKGEVLTGTKLGLRIAAGNVPNLVDLETGGLGPVIQDPLNSSQTATLATFNTLANLLAGCITQVTPDACSRLFAAATDPHGNVPTDTLLAAVSIARYPWHQPEKIFALLNDFYPVPQGKNLRPTPFMPYLTWAPSAWVLPLKFTGGGLCAPGKMMVDSQGNVWAGDNFIVGAQNQDA